MIISGWNIMQIPEFLIDAGNRLCYMKLLSQEF